jgi:hypothetical protein
MGVIQGGRRKWARAGGKSWLGCVERLSRAAERCCRHRDTLLLRAAKMAERVLSSVGVEGGWDGMMRRDAGRGQRRGRGGFKDGLQGLAQNRVGWGREGKGCNC